MPDIHLHYLHHALKREMTELYAATLIRGLALGMLGLFTPLYFFKEGWSIELIIIWFAINYIIFGLLAPFGAMLTGKYGHEKTMAISVPISLVYYVLLFYLPQVPWFFWASSAILGLMKAIYWVAYHAEFASIGNKKEIGEEIGFLRVLVTLIGIVAPALGGYIISQWGFEYVFIVGGILIVTSIIPLLSTKQKWDPINISYKQCAKLLQSKKLKSDLLGHMATGETLVAQAIWPIWLFMIIPSYTDVGILTTVTIFLSFIIMLWIGKLSNHKNKSSLIKKAGGAVSFSWLIRAFAYNPITIFFSDTMYKISAKSLHIPYVALSYTRTSKKHIIQYTAFWMMAIAIGKTIAAIAILITLAFTQNLIFTFFTASILSLLYFTWKDAITK